jgi:SAM-dependent methyltransferase
MPILDRLVLGDLAQGALVLDLCCGTGQLGAALNEQGYRVIGIDSSAAMIDHARLNAPESDFLVADAQSFTVPEPADAAVSTYDSLNHLMSQADLTAAFGQVNRSLVSGGAFLFDLNMIEGYRSRWTGSFGLVGDDEVVVGRSSFDPDAAVGRMEFTIMTPDGHLWQRDDIALTQRCYREEDVRSALSEAGFDDVDVIDYRDVGSDEVGRSIFRCRAPGES